MRILKRRIVIFAAAAIVIAAAFASAQQVFRAGVDLVHFAVVVTDKAGQQIDGLKVEDVTAISVLRRDTRLHCGQLSNLALWPIARKTRALGSSRGAARGSPQGEEVNRARDEGVNPPWSGACGIAIDRRASA